MANFPIYLPWDPERTDFVMRHARTDLLMLDIQLGSACNARCPRCDSSCSDLKEPASIDLDALCSLAEEIDQRHRALNQKTGTGFLPGGRNMGFICGLGEPTASRNMTKLKKILERTAQYGFSWSMFTNGLYWDETLDQYLKSGQLFVTVQYNSRRPEVIAEMMGVSLESAATHLRNRLHLQALAKHLNECHIERTGVSFAGVAASMVPERGNLDEIMDMIDEANRHGMFPSIGELERAGHSTGEYYESHKLEKHELQVLHQRIEQRFGVQYERPICPAAIGAIHVNNRGIVTVDKFTGLTCNWFGMKDPEVYEIGDIRKMRRSEITRAILEYRESRIGEVRKSMNDYYPETVFGGCGGKARKMLAKYVSLYD